jgi:PfaB family protein
VEKIAIIGMDATFGAYRTLEALERSIYCGTQHFIPFPSDRISRVSASGDFPSGAYIEPFDSLSFSEQPSDIYRLTSSQQLMLQVAEAALKDTNVSSGKSVAIIITAENKPLVPSVADRNSQAYVDDIARILASRIEARWNLDCPAFTLITGQNSTFKALELARTLLSSERADMALVGAVDLIEDLESLASKSTLEKNDSESVEAGVHTLSYDRNARGNLLGEGAGALVLKRLDYARQQQDRIYAVMDAIAIVQGSRAIAEPGEIAQACRLALEQADVKPENIGYLEVSGNGIDAEDTAEIQGLTAAYAYPSKDGLSCAVGSVKTTIGHTRNASGIASLIKTALCLYHRYLPITPQWSGPKHPELWQNSLFYIPTRSRLWLIPPNASRRAAAMNGVGSDLNYAHIVLSEEPHAKELRSSYLEQTPFYLFPLAGSDRTELLAQLETLAATVEAVDSLAKAASQVFIDFRLRSELPYAVAITGHSKEEVRREIERAQTGIPKAFEQGTDWKTPLGSYFSPKPQGRQGGVAFVYPGAFTSYMGLIDSINRLFPKVMDSLAIFNASQRMRQLMDVATQEVYPRTLEKLSARQMERLELKLQDDATTMLLFGTGAAVFFTTILRDYFRLEPQAAFGYSLGEFSMMYALKAWTRADEIAERLHRSPLFKTRLSGSKDTIREYWGLPAAAPEQEALEQEEFWGTYVLLSDPATVKTAIECESRVYLTHINTPTEVVIAGDNQACQRVIQELNCDYFPAPSKHVLHCEAMASEFDELTDWFTLPVQPVPQVALYTAATYGRTRLDSQEVSRSIAKALCQPLDFPHLIRQVYGNGARVFIELGPGGTCSRWIRETLKQEDHTTITFNTRGVDDHTSTLRALAKLVGHCVPLDLACLYEPIPSASAPPQTSQDKLPPEPPQKPIEKAPGSSPFPRKPSNSPSRNREIAPNRTPANPSDLTTAGSPSSRTATLEKPSSSTSWHQNNALSRNGTVSKLQPHASFLEMRQESLRQMGQLIGLQMVAAKSMLMEAVPVPLPAPIALKRPSQRPFGKPTEKPIQKPAVLGEAAILEFATGKIASVFGSDYAEIDSYPKRLRLPMPPYLFVSRVTQLDAERGHFGPCSIETEYDIPLDAWYAVGSQVPTAIFVEAYQSIILLLSYLGVDFEIKGEQSFRALDGTLEFLGKLPEAGETFRCHVQVHSFTRSTGTFLCFYDCNYFVGDRKFLTIKAGGGLFAEQTLKKASGITFTKLELAARNKIPKQSFTPLLPCSKVAFHEQDLLRLGTGDLAACFGEPYAPARARNPSLRSPASAFRMIDRALSVNPKGGAWGLGMLVAEKDLHPEQWYFNCHFKDDYCMPGTVVVEGATQLLQFYLLYLGLQSRTSQAQFHPIPHLLQTSRSRGQIVPMHGKLIYQLEVFEVGLEPTPFLKAEVLVKLQGKTISSIKNLGVQLWEEST